MNVAAVVLSLWSLVAFWLQRVTPHSTPLPTRRAPPPVPFFAPGANLVDLHDGNGAERDALANRAGLVVVMFYAPWSLHSMEARGVFRQTANSLDSNTNSTVQFVAVNCHYHRGSCRTAYKLYSYPVVFAYVANGPLVLFNRPLVPDVLRSWVTYLLRPYVRIQSEEEFSSFVAGSDYSVVGFVDAYASPRLIGRSFNVFHASAAKASTLPFSVSFAVLQNRALASRLGLAPNQLNLYTNYDPEPATFASLVITSSVKSDNVLQWARDNVMKMAWRTVERLNFDDDENGGKSLFRKANATDGTVVLFTNGIYTGRYTFAHLQLKTLAMAFHDCSVSRQQIISNSTSAAADSELDWRRELRGLACRTNRTVGFAVAERRFAEFLIQRWKSWSNYDLLHHRRNGTDNDDGSYDNDSDLVAFVSNTDEQFFWLDGADVNSESISRLIVDFSTEKLPPNRPILVEITNSTGPCFHPTDKNHPNVVGVSHLQRINVSEFLSGIVGQRNDFDSFVFISGGRWHGPSQFVPHLLHVVVNYFRRFDALIRFYILDASKNQLPWQYTFETLPAFVFFPARRKMESVAFPSADFPLTVPNLMAFVLAHCQPTLRFQLALSVCGRTCLARNAQQLRDFVRRIDGDIRSLRRQLRHASATGDHLRMLLRRRFVQRRVARYLQETVDALLQARRDSARPFDTDEAQMPTDSIQHLTKDLLLLRWMLKSHSALQYRLE